MKRFHLIPLVAAAFLCLAAFSALDDATAASVVPRCDKSEVQMTPLAADAVSTAVFSAFWMVSSLLSHTTTCTSQLARAANAA